MKFKSLKKLGLSVFATTAISASVILPVANAVSDNLTSIPVTISTTEDKGDNLAVITAGVLKDVDVNKIIVRLELEEKARAEAEAKLKEEKEKAEAKKEAELRAKEAKKFTLDKKISGFSNSANAKEGVNPVVVVGSGEYIVFAEYNGMVNITEIEGEAGAWINPNHEEPIKVQEVIVENSNENAQSVNTSKSEQASNQQASIQTTSKGAAILAAARGQLGWAQDCTMLVTNALRAVGINFHDWPIGYLSLGYEVSIDQAQPGDLIYYDNAGAGVPHIAVYAGNGRAIHGGWNGNQTTEWNAFFGSGIRVVRVR